MRIFVLCLLITTHHLFGQQFISEKYQNHDFKLFYSNKVASILYDKNDFKVVEIASNLQYIRRELLSFYAETKATTKEAEGDTADGRKLSGTSRRH